NKLTTYIYTLSLHDALPIYVIILTGDHDILQLIDEQISVAIMRKGQGNYEMFDDANFYVKKGITPKQIIDLKGLMGDTADNYPGDRKSTRLNSSHVSISYAV